MNMMNRIQSVEPKKLLEHICDLVENDFCADMETLLLPNTREYTQEEAKEMAKLLARVYSYAHQFHCNAHINKQKKGTAKIIAVNQPTKGTLK